MTQSSNVVLTAHDFDKMCQPFVKISELITQRTPNNLKAKLFFINQLLAFNYIFASERKPVEKLDFLAPELSNKAFLEAYKRFLQQRLDNKELFQHLDDPLLLQDFHNLIRELLVHFIQAFTTTNKSYNPQNLCENYNEVYEILSKLIHTLVVKLFTLTKEAKISIKFSEIVKLKSNFKDDKALELYTYLFSLISFNFKHAPVEVNRNNLAFYNLNYLTGPLAQALQQSEYHCEQLEVIGSNDFKLRELFAQDCKYWDLYWQNFHAFKESFYQCKSKLVNLGLEEYLEQTPAYSKDALVLIISDKDQLKSISLEQMLKPLKPQGFLYLFVGSDVLYKPNRKTKDFVAQVIATPKLQSCFFLGEGLFEALFKSSLLVFQKSKTEPQIQFIDFSTLKAQELLEQKVHFDEQLGVVKSLSTTQVQTKFNQQGYIAPINTSFDFEYELKQRYDHLVEELNDLRTQLAQVLVEEKL
ncbi:hypothetical protein [Psittacicella gerlachiana]|uniref:Uncharacterized protein n=1 Tax=Psittacicella gerlachiana TaxID=2028574 RepID=A0A3A1YGH9_9GAMM|nr:hypothetical protein [Psittacicella gerlachiana]RIY36785.1 hypothetical protein CKF59_02270 [Psittacicella gerlachiana]